MSLISRIESQCADELSRIEREYYEMMRGKQCTQQEAKELPGRMEALGNLINDAGIIDKELRAHYAAIANVVRTALLSSMTP